MPAAELQDIPPNSHNNLLSKNSDIWTIIGNLNSHTNDREITKTLIDCLKEYRNSRSSIFFQLSDSRKSQLARLLNEMYLLRSDPTISDNNLLAVVQAIDREIVDEYKDKWGIKSNLLIYLREFQIKYYKNAPSWEENEALRTQRDTLSREVDQLKKVVDGQKNLIASKNQLIEHKNSEISQLSQLVLKLVEEGKRLEEKCSLQEERLQRLQGEYEKASERPRPS